MNRMITDNISLSGKTVHRFRAAGDWTSRPRCDRFYKSDISRAVARKWRRLYGRHHLLFLINTLWSFSKSLHGKNMSRFIVVSMIGCFLAMTVSGLADLYSFHYAIGIIWVALTVPPVTFLLHSFWTYR